MKPKRGRPTKIKEEAITVPHYDTEEEVSEERDDTSFEPSQEQPSTSSYITPERIKKGPAIYFADSALDTFANYNKLVDIAANNYSTKEDYLNPSYVKSMTRGKWLPSLYFASKNSSVNINDPGCIKFKQDVKEKQSKTGSGLDICPNNIINDVSWLEVLIGGKRAGNNSPEIINEAAAGRVNHTNYFPVKILSNKNIPIE